MTQTLFEWIDSKASASSRAIARRSSRRASSATEQYRSRCQPAAGAACSRADQQPPEEMGDPQVVTTGATARWAALCAPAAADR